MRILEFRAENIKNLKVVEIHPGEDSVILEGKNGAGKSAILDAILMALTGKKIERPIREGESRAEINVDLGEYKIRRVFTSKGERLELLSSEGAIFKTPQALLDKILGKLTFDPLAFAGMSERQQRELLAGLVGLDFTELNKQREQLYNERTIKNREIKGSDPTAYRKDSSAPLPLESLVGTMEKPSEGTPRQEIDMAEELTKIEALEKRTLAYRDYELKRDELTGHRAACEKEIQHYESNISDIEQRITELQKDIAGFRGGISVMTEEIAATNERLASLPEPESIDPKQIEEARRQLLKVEENNKIIRKAIEFDRAIERLEEARKEVAKLEEAMAGIDLEKQRRLNEAKFPIDGLGLTDEYVTFQGKPFNQLSTGEQMRVSTAVAMALNPTLKIVLIREGSLLDSDGLKTVIDIAKEKDYQLWIERVSDDKGVGIYLEAGEIAKG